MNDRTNGTGGSVSYKQMAVLLGALATVGSLHALWVMPMILNKVAPQIEAEIQKYHAWHIQHVHPGAITDKALDRTLKPIHLRLQSIDRHLEKIEKKIEDGK